MINSELALLPIYLNQAEGRNGQISKGVSIPGFSSVLNSIIADQNPLTQENIKTSDTSCDCDKTKKCMCDSDDETTETDETKKTGIAACMDCPCRKAGECALWKGKEDIFDMLGGMSYNTSVDRGISLSHKQLDFRPDFVAMAETWLDYNNAYAYITKKQLGILMLD